MFIHKYLVDGESFYRLSPKSRPTDTVRLSPSNLKERIPASQVENYLSSIEESFKKTPKEEKDPDAKKPDEKKKKMSMADDLRILAAALTGE